MSIDKVWKITIMFVEIQDETFVGNQEREQLRTLQREGDVGWAFPYIHRKKSEWQYNALGAKMASQPTGVRYEEHITVMSTNDIDDPCPEGNKCNRTRETLGITKTGGMGSIKPAGFSIDANMLQDEVDLDTMVHQERGKVKGEGDTSHV